MSNPYGLISIAALKRNPPPMLPAIWGPTRSPLIVQPSLVWIGAEQKAGKSLFAMDFLMALLDPNRTEFLGFPITTVDKILYLNEEVPQPYVAFRSQLMWGPQDRPHEERFITSDRRGLRFDTDADLLANLVRETGARIVCVDPFDRFHGWNTNDNQQMGVLLARFHAVIQHYGIVLILVHHFSKEQVGDQRSSFTRFRGAGRLLGDADSLFSLEKRNGGLYRLDAQLRHGEWPDALELVRGPNLRYAINDPDSGDEAEEEITPDDDETHIALASVATGIELIRQCMSDASDVKTILKRAANLGLTEENARALLAQERQCDEEDL